MKMSELADLINKLVQMEKMAESILNGKMNGMALTQEQIDGLTVKCIAIKNEALLTASSLTPNEFGLELDSEPDQVIEDV